MCAQCDKVSEINLIQTTTVGSQIISCEFNGEITGLVCHDEIRNRNKNPIRFSLLRNCLVGLKMNLKFYQISYNYIPQ